MSDQLEWAVDDKGMPFHNGWFRIVSRAKKCLALPHKVTSQSKYPHSGRSSLDCACHKEAACCEQQAEKPKNLKSQTDIQSFNSRSSLDGNSCNEDMQDGSEAEKTNLGPRPHKGPDNGQNEPIFSVKFWLSRKMVDFWAYFLFFVISMLAVIRTF